MLGKILKIREIKNSKKVFTLRKEVYGTMKPVKKKKTDTPKDPPLLNMRSGLEDNQ